MHIVVKVLWFVVFVYSIAMLVFQEAEWFKYRKSHDRTMGKTMKNYFTLQAKNLIPAVLGIVALLIVFLG